MSESTTQTITTKGINYIIEPRRKRTWRVKQYYIKHYDTGEIIDGPFPATTMRGASKLAGNQKRIPYGVPYKMEEL